MRRQPRITSVAGRLASLLLAAGLAACAEGYPPDSQATGARTPQERGESLEQLLRTGSSEVESFTVRTPCEVVVKWKGRPPQAYDLADLNTSADTDEATGDFMVFLTSASGGGPPRLLLTTPEWATSAMVRSEVSQLRADCAMWKK